MTYRSPSAEEDIARQIETLIAACRYFGWNETQAHLVRAHRTLVEPIVSISARKLASAPMSAPILSANPQNK